MEFDKQKARTQKLEITRAAKQISKVLLTDRDLDILDFLLDMKFADLRALHAKFFRVLLTGHESSSLWYAQERMGILRAHGYVLSKRILFHGPVYFVASHLAQTTLANVRGGTQPVRSSGGIDIRTFEHDDLVLKCRLALESSGAVTNWWSERRLKSESALTNGLARKYMPDAIVVSSQGVRIAFELERARKSRLVYRDKIAKYVQHIRAQKDHAQAFRKVLFVCVNTNVYRALIELTQMYRAYFEVVELNALLSDRSSEFLTKGVQS